jgi:hypothetical protein
MLLFGKCKSRTNRLRIEMNYLVVLGEIIVLAIIGLAVYLVCRKK